MAVVSRECDDVPKAHKGQMFYSQKSYYSIRRQNKFHLPVY